MQENEDERERICPVWEPHKSRCCVITDIMVLPTHSVTWCERILCRTPKTNRSIAVQLQGMDSAMNMIYDNGPVSRRWWLKR